LFQEIAHIRSIVPKDLVNTSFTRQRWVGHWRPKKEQTSLSESKLHFGHYKAGALLVIIWIGLLVVRVGHFHPIGQRELITQRRNYSFLRIYHSKFSLLCQKLNTTPFHQKSFWSNLETSNHNQWPPLNWLWVESLKH
jgi:hypothetical protein